MTAYILVILMCTDTGCTPTYAEHYATRSECMAQTAPYDAWHGEASYCVPLED